eukprot:6182164-Pleurochrysis_carterae.AAC.2
MFDPFFSESTGTRQPALYAVVDLGMGCSGHGAKRSSRYTDACRYSSRACCVLARSSERHSRCSSKVRGGTGARVTE